MWKNFDDLEQELTLEELMETYTAIYDRENRGYKFHATLQGAEIDDANGKESARDRYRKFLRERAGEVVEQSETREIKENFSKLGVAYKVI